jgi:hypothetical protein
VVSASAGAPAAHSATVSAEAVRPARLVFRLIAFPD